MDNRYFPLFRQALADGQTLCATVLPRCRAGMDNFGFSPKRWTTAELCRNAPQGCPEVRYAGGLDRRSRDFYRRSRQGDAHRCVIPARAGTQGIRIEKDALDPRLRGDDEGALYSRLRGDDGVSRRVGNLLPTTHRREKVGRQAAHPTGLRRHWRIIAVIAAFTVIPAKAGIQCVRVSMEALDPHLRGDDELRVEGMNWHRPRLRGMTSYGSRT